MPQDPDFIPVQRPQAAPDFIPASQSLTPPPLSSAPGAPAKYAAPGNKRIEPETVLTPTEFGERLREPNHPLPGVSEGRGLREGLAEYDRESFGNIGKGTADVARGNIARGGHEIISGGVNALTPTAPLFLPAAPAAAARGLIGGAAGGYLGHKGAEFLGATPDQADLAGDVGGLVGATAGSALTRRVASAPIRAGARTVEGIANSKFRPIAKLFTPADEAVQAKIRVPGRDFGLPKPATPDYLPEPKVLHERLGNAEPTTPLDRIRDQELPPANPDYTPPRPSIGRILPPEPEPINPGAPLPERPTTELRQASALENPGHEPPEEPSAALGRIPAAAPRSPSQTAMAFRARSAGEQGIPHNPTSPAQATMSQPEAEGFLGGREDVTGEPQELVGVDLGEAPGFSTRPGPSGNDWVKFHGDVPESAIQPISAAKPSAVSPELLGQQLNDALGGRPLEPGVPLRQQLSRIGKPTAPIKTAPLTNLSEQIKESAPLSQAPTMAPLGDLGSEIKSSAIELPEGFTATPDSSVLAGYKYNPATREFEAITNRGDHYVHSDVSPEEAAKFEAADSKGSAWNQLKKGPGVTLTKSGPVGKLEPVKPGTLKTSKGVIAKSKAGMNPDADPNADLTAKLKASVKKVEAEKRARARAQ